jgi:hypothetical protein
LTLENSEPGRSQLWKGKKRKLLGTLLLEWQEGTPFSATLSQTTSFEDADITRWSRQFSEGAEWHTLPDPLPGSAEALEFPGLEQQWMSTGSQADTWLGAGLRGEKFFLIFRNRKSPANALPFDELALNPKWHTVLDTLPGFVSKNCQKTEWPKALKCFESIEGSGPAFAQWEKSIEVRIMDPTGYQDLFDAASQTPAGERDTWIRDFKDWRLAEGRAALVRVMSFEPWILNATTAILPNRLSGSDNADSLSMDFREKGVLPNPLTLLRWELPYLKSLIRIRSDGRIYVRFEEKTE